MDAQIQLRNLVSQDSVVILASNGLSTLVGGLVAESLSDGREVTFISWRVRPPEEIKSVNYLYFDEQASFWQRRKQLRRIMSALTRHNTGGRTHIFIPHNFGFIVTLVLAQVSESSVSYIEEGVGSWPDSSTLFETYVPQTRIKSRLLHGIVGNYRSMLNGSTPPRLLIDMSSAQVGVALSEQAFRGFRNRVDILPVARSVQDLGPASRAWSAQSKIPFPEVLLLFGKIPSNLDDAGQLQFCSELVERAEHLLRSEDDQSGQLVCKLHPSDAKVQSSLEKVHEAQSRWHVCDTWFSVESIFCASIHVITSSKSAAYSAELLGCRVTVI